MSKPPSSHWKCHRCGATNAPGIEDCRSCSAPALASSRDVGKTNTLLSQEDSQLQSEPIGEEYPQLPDTDVDTKLNAKQNDGNSVWLIVFGTYLMAGAYSSIVNQHWPIFMPPQLDLVAFIAGGWDSVSAAYIAGGITGVLGVICVILGFLVFVRRVKQAAN